LLKPAIQPELLGNGLETNFIEEAFNLIRGESMQELFLAPRHGMLVYLFHFLIIF